MADSKNSNPDERKYFQKVLDDVVSLNSLFTVAVFIGLSLAQPGQVQSLEGTCNPDINIRKRLVAYEIASFSCFIFSGILAKTVNFFLYTYKNQDGVNGRSKKNPERHWKSQVGFFLSIYGTIIGCLLLLLAMVDVVQIKLGRLSCHGGYMIGTVSVMGGTVGLSLLIYFITVTYGMYYTPKKAKEGGPNPA